MRFEYEDSNIKDDITINLIDNMMELLNDLSKQYPKNIIVKER